MRRAFDLDVLACARCGGRRRLIATIEDPVAIGAILAALDQSSDLAGRAPPFAAAQPTNLLTTDVASTRPLSRLCSEIIPVVAELNPLGTAPGQRPRR